MKFQREFSASVGMDSVGTAGPDAIEQDLDKISKILDPEQPGGGIQRENIAFNFSEQPEISGKVAYGSPSARFIRVNGDRVIETSEDGVSYQVTGSSGHIILDASGAPVEQRARLRFDNCVVTDDGVATVVEGIVGPQGPQGPQGPLGPQGIKGDIGNSIIPEVDQFTGLMTFTQGPAGAIPSPVYVRGPQGPQGVQGMQGEQGIQGPQGPAGPQGADGVNGTNGVNGAPGPAGAQGVQGAQGPTGPMGPQGDPGPRGLQGLTGAQGAQGATGATGATGPQGAQGPLGPQGIQGPKGADGTSFAVKGLFSSLGALQTAHPTGSLGDAYAVGSALSNVIYNWSVDESQWVSLGSLQGPQGPQGIQGVQGPQGTPGPKGDTGATGAAGPQGEQGPTGKGYYPQGSWIQDKPYTNSDTQIDTVSYNGSSYYCKQSHTSSAGASPENASYWGLLATKGSDGLLLNADWNANSGYAQILNKPTTLAGYGITDGAPGPNSITDSQLGTDIKIGSLAALGTTAKNSVVAAIEEVRTSVKPGILMGVNTSANDSYVATIDGVTEYTDGLVILLKATVANTAACSVNINGLGAKEIRRYINGSLAALATGDILANTQNLLIYSTSSGYFTLVNDSSAVVELTTTQTLTNKTLTAPRITSGSFIADPNGNELIKFPTTVASAVNEITVSNTATGGKPSIAATGGDTNITLNLVPKGTGTVQANGVDVTTTTGTQTLTNKTLTSPTLTAPRMPSAGAITDANGNELILFPATVGSAVNEITVSNAAAGGTPTIAATGGDANINLTVNPKGTGVVRTTVAQSTDTSCFRNITLSTSAPSGGIDGDVWIQF